MYTTKEDAAEMVGQAIDAGTASREDYDIDRITDQCFEYSPEMGGYVQVVDEPGFWAAVEECAL